MLKSSKHPKFHGRNPSLGAPSMLGLKLEQPRLAREDKAPSLKGAFGADESWWQREIFWEIPLKMSWNITEIEPWWRLNMSWRWIPILALGNGLGNPNHLTRKHVRNSLFQQSSFSGENSHHIKHQGDRRQQFACWICQNWMPLIGCLVPKLTHFHH